MKPIDRRDFLKGAATAVGCTFLGSGIRFLEAAEPSAELVLKNGLIATMSDKLPWVKALAVRGGRILSVGSDEQIQRYVGRDTRIIDLDGKGVSPGLIDSHSHVIGFGQMQRKYVLLRPPKVNSFKTLKETLARAARKKPAGQWIVGRGFNEFKEGRFPRRWELDEAVDKHPVLIIHWGGQFGVANTLALKKANLLRTDAKDPYGGKYLRDRRNGLPDGTLTHYPAIYSVYQPTPTEAEQLDCAAWGMKQFAAQGVTCVHDNFCHPQYARGYVHLERTGKLPCRVRVYPYIKNLQQCQLLVKKIRRYKGPLVRMQGIKLAVDGYALMYKTPKDKRHLAIPMHPQGQFNEIIAAIHGAGFQADVHAVGDKGVDWTLAAFARAAGGVQSCRKRRHRIEHFPFRKLDSIRRAAELGVPVCLQPEFIRMKADDFRRKLGSYGKELTHTMLPVRTFLDQGVHLAFGADVPAFPSHLPMDSIRSAMERKTPGGRKLDRAEAVEFLEALRIHTLGGAWIAFDEGDIGSLEAGKAADFVIWNRDLKKVRTPQKVAALKPQATYLAGKAVYEVT